MSLRKTKYDVIVVGGGHAGAEASYACAKGGLDTLLITLNLDSIGQMSCNPAIGGIAKGHIVREIDALGGLMAKTIDQTGIHFKMLNQSRGPAVWAPRAQAEKTAYQNKVKWQLEATPNLSFYQDRCEALLLKNHKIYGIQGGRGQEFFADYIVLTTGTFLRGLIHIGKFQQNSGRIAEGNSQSLSASLEKYGFRLERLKTGTPPRILARTVDFSKMQEQKPDVVPQAFSFSTSKITQKQISCWLTKTNPKVHKLIQENLDTSPLYSGQIQSSGPRYCPSIEDKVVRFPQRESHQIFVEPEGIETGELYLNGISTSLPESLQWEIVRRCQGLEEAEIIKPGYAVEYDYIDPKELYPSLESKKIQNLYFAGQINGTTGYEEAGAQGFVAGANILKKSKGQEPFILDRGESYIGVLIDDLVYKGVEDPYRMFTSRAEHRLLLRQDNADYRLIHHGLDLGLVSKTQYQDVQEKYKHIESLRKKIYATSLRPIPSFQSILKKKNIKDRDSNYGKTMAQFLKRPEIRINDCLELLPDLANIDKQKQSILEMEIKYEGYIKREKQKIKERNAMVNVKLPPDLDYSKILGLKKEAQEKLSRSRPFTIAGASSISGVNPTDIDLLCMHLKSFQTLKKQTR